MVAQERGCTDRVNCTQLLAWEDIELIAHHVYPRAQKAWYVTSDLLNDQRSLISHYGEFDAPTMPVPHSHEGLVSWRVISAARFPPATVTELLVHELEV